MSRSFHFDVHSPCRTSASGASGEWRVTRPAQSTLRQGYEMRLYSCVIKPVVMPVSEAGFRVAEGLDFS